MSQNTVAKHPFYVSMDNGIVYPAMTSPAGYEDEHPSEWRPANSFEIEQYKSGKANVGTPAPVPVDLPPPAATPSTIQLADDPVQEAPLASAIPGAPAPAIPPAPFTPPPAPIED